MEMIILGGLLLVVISMLITSSKRHAVDESLDHAHVIQGVALAIMAVGAFGFGQWLSGVVFLGAKDVVFKTVAGGLFTVPLLLTFLFPQSHVPEPVLSTYLIENRDRDRLSRSG
jgi:hypothetical protein